MIDRLAYTVKQRSPRTYNLLFKLTRSVTAIRHGPSRRRAYRSAQISGSISGRDAIIRPLYDYDGDSLSGFLSSLPEEYLTYFHPHSFTPDAVGELLQSTTTCCYGIFQEKEIVGYCLVKLFPTTNAYCGLIVSPCFAGIGLGKTMWQYLIWQCVLMRVKPCATIYRENMASMGSLRAIRKTLGISPLSDGYLRITIPVTEHDKTPPKFAL